MSTQEEVIIEQVEEDVTIEDVLKLKYAEQLDLLFVQDAATQKELFADYKNYFVQVRLNSKAILTNTSKEAQSKLFYLFTDSIESKTQVERSLEYFSKKIVTKCYNAFSTDELREKYKNELVIFAHMSVDSKRKTDVNVNAYTLTCSLEALIEKASEAQKLRDQIDVLNEHFAELGFTPVKVKSKSSTTSSKEEEVDNIEVTVIDDDFFNEEEEE